MLRQDEVLNQGGWKIRFLMQPCRLVLVSKGKSVHSLLGVPPSHPSHCSERQNRSWELPYCWFH